VVLGGFPNAGKSSLLNALLGRPAAIAHAAPGTTRDPVRGVTSMRGRRIEWIDVAGVRDAAVFLPPAAGAGEAEAEVGFGGCPEDREVWRIVRRLTRVEVEHADCVVWVADPVAGLDDSLREFHRLPASRKLLAIQKADLIDPERRRELAGRPEAPAVVSALERSGLDELVDRVLAGGDAPFGAHRVLVGACQATFLDAAAEALRRARAAIGGGEGYECVAADLRDAEAALAEVVGAAPREAVLDSIFSRFCIGK
jgi:tRNA modification GTPase